MFPACDRIYGWFYVETFPCNVLVDATVKFMVLFLSLISLLALYRQKADLGHASSFAMLLAFYVTSFLRSFFIFISTILEPS